MILVTGATGFLGRHVVRALVEAGYPVRALAHAGRESVLAPYGVEVVHGDVRDPGAARRAMQDVTAVVHLVATIRERGGETFQRVNHEGTAVVARAASEAGVQRLVHLSALGARDDPRYPYFRYFRSKSQGEQAVVESGVPYTILRPSFLFGPGDELFNVLAATVKIAPVVPIPVDGSVRFQPVHVEDMAQCVVRSLILEELVNRTVELGGPDHLTYPGMIDILAETLGVRRLKLRMPLSLVSAAARLMGLVLPRPPVTPTQLSMLRFDNTTSIDAIAQHFGITPRPLRGNLDYVQGITLADALKVSLGVMPDRIRDH